MLNINATALPLTLLSFEGEKMEKTNQLTWITGTEENTESHFIERSADGRRWEVIGEVNAAGFSTIEQKYEFTDKQPLALSYYRLKSMDFDASYQLSNVLSLQRKQKNFHLNQIFPNPVNQMLSLDFSNDENREVEITISDLTDRVVYATQYDAQNGLNRHEFDVSNLNPGIYLVSLNNGTTQLTKRIVKVRN